ncbi:endonuclease/exonuclease/phosphatase family protein [Bacteroides sp. 224]|uniref:endonuclease/exonuclease/phosphatase family protein n=1 Tax=Bacteroides sp. 224 TaxID=2302936 RepID=UPI0013D7137B|nr:endonuclease/exonuclease/phosphatase family protein [Bacteroides sp. 224]NDV65666.1 endonuclease [Bacteroides sp. 224]
MKSLGKIAILLIMTGNVVFIILLLLSAYSPYMNPAKVPLLGCMGLIFPIFLIVNVCFLVFWLPIRYKLALVPLVALLLCFPQIRAYIPVNIRTKNIPENSIKLLTYNVMNFNTMEKVDGKSPILAYIKNSGADIICLQEFVPASNRKYLTQENINDVLKEYPYRRIHKLGKLKNNGIACYSKYPILSDRVLSYESDSNGSVVYEIKIGNDTITLINNHLESNKLTTEDRKLYENLIESPESAKVKRGARYLLGKLKEAVAIRGKQGKVIREEVKNAPHKSVIVCGDFNDSPLSYPHHLLTKELNDAFSQSGSGLGISFNRNKFYFRIDHILMSKNLKAYNCTVDRSIKDSDHYPMWCYISKRK